MAIREDAQRNHDVLFPDHVSTLKVTDPELIEIFDNWPIAAVGIMATASLYYRGRRLKPPRGLPTPRTSSSSA